MLPVWLNSENLRTLLMGVLIVKVIGVLILLRLLRGLMTRIVLIAVVAALGVGVWLQRTNLETCVKTCSCEIFGRQVEIPANRNPSCATPQPASEDAGTG